MKGFIKVTALVNSQGQLSYKPLLVNINYIVYVKSISNDDIHSELIISENRINSIQIKETYDEIMDLILNCQ